MTAAARVPQPQIAEGSPCLQTPVTLSAATSATHRGLNTTTTVLDTFDDRVSAAAASPPSPSPSPPVLPPPPTPPPRPPPPSPPSGTFLICAETPCLVRASELASLNTLNWVVEEGHTLEIDANFTTKDIIVRGRVQWNVDAENAVLSASRILVERNGVFWAGNETLPLTRRATIELRTPDSDPSGTGLMEANGMRDGSSPTIEIHGEEHARSWTLLDQPAMPTDTHIVVKDAVDWRVEDKIAIGGWNPSRGRNLGLTPGYVTYEPKNFGGTGLRTVNATLQLETTDHSVAAFEKGMILINGDQHLKVHCNDTRCCRLFHNATDCTRPVLAPKHLPCVEHRSVIHAPHDLTDDDEYACCVYAAKAQTGAATC